MNTPTTQREAVDLHRLVRRFCVLADIPNQEGYRFIGRTHGGDLLPCIVKKDSVGCHGAYNERDGSPCFMQLEAWSEYSANDEMRDRHPLDAREERDEARQQERIHYDNFLSMQKERDKERRELQLLLESTKVEACSDPLPERDGEPADFAGAIRRMRLAERERDEAREQLRLANIDCFAALTELDAAREKIAELLGKEAAK